MKSMKAIHARKRLTVLLVETSLCSLVLVDLLFLQYLALKLGVPSLLNSLPVFHSHLYCFTFEDN